MFNTEIHQNNTKNLKKCDISFLSKNIDTGKTNDIFVVSMYKLVKKHIKLNISKTIVAQCNVHPISCHVSYR